MSGRSKNKRLVAVLAGGALAAGIWGLWGSGDDAGLAAADQLPNQVWIDRVPENDRDMITHMLLLDHPRAKNFGMIGHSSQWRHQIELMRWGLKGSTLGLMFPQDRRKAKLRAKTWSCAGEAPEPFDLCLELSRGDRSVRLFSHHDWVVEPQRAAASFEELQAEVPALSSLNFEAVVSQDDDEDKEDKEADDYVESEATLLGL